MIDLFVRGGPLFMVPLLVASVFVIAVTIERILSYRQADVDYDDFHEDMQGALRSGGVREAHGLAQEYAGPVARVWYVGLGGARLPLPVLRERMESAAQRELARLEQFLPAVSVIGTVAPLVGILGTVWGMIVAFQGVEGGLSAGLGVRGEVLAGGIWKALITTASGLLVAVPAIIAHQYLDSRVERFAEQLERSMVDVVEGMLSVRQRSTAAPRGENVPVLEAE